MTDTDIAKMLALYGAGFWLFCQSRLRQTPRVENILKVPRFFCAYFSTIKVQSKKLEFNFIKKLMKKLLLIICITLISSHFTFAGNTEAGNSRNVQITGVSHQYNTDGTYTEIVNVSLTQEAIRNLTTSGLTKYVVKVSPKNSVWSFFIDLREAQTLALTVNNPYGSVYFKSKRKNSSSDFVAETPWGPSR